MELVSTKTIYQEGTQEHKKKHFKIVAWEKKHTQKIQHYTINFPILTNAYTLKLSCKNMGHSVAGGAHKCLFEHINLILY